jgi:hypothetical protein
MATDVSEVCRDTGGAAPPAVATRYTERSVAPAARDVTGVRVRTRGEVRFGRGWWPYRGHEVTLPRHGYFREMRVSGVLRVVDSWVAGIARRETTILGRHLRPALVGPDLSRSDLAHAAMSTMFVPSVLVPSDVVRWTPEGRDIATVAFAVAGAPASLRLTLHRSGLPRRIETTRWGDPGHTGLFREESFGADILEHRTFGGLTIPATGVLGWGPDARGTTREVLRFQVTALEPIRGECRDALDIGSGCFPPEAAEGE